MNLTKTKDVVNLKTLCRSKNQRVIILKAKYPKILCNTNVFQTLITPNHNT